MPYSDNKEQWFRDIISDHYQSPRNKGLVSDEDYKIIHLKNPSCGDDLIVQVKVNDNIVEDVRFEGSGCAICCASASMMSINTKQKTIEEAKKIIQEFYDMVSGQSGFDEETLGEAISLQGVAKLPPRIKCASLAYKALQQVLFNIDVEDEEIKVEK